MRESQYSVKQLQKGGKKSSLLEQIPVKKSQSSENDTEIKITENKSQTSGTGAENNELVVSDEKG